MDREWYSDDPEWQKSHQDVDSARAERRAANEYREKQEKAQRARDLSTQAAMDEKLAMRKALDSNNSVSYNKYTGEYTINVDKLPDTGKWEVTTTDGKIVVDSAVEARAAALSKVMEFPYGQKECRWKCTVAIHLIMWMKKNWHFK